jgi:hypothetical protein
LLVVVKKGISRCCMDFENLSDGMSGRSRSLTLFLFLVSIFLTLFGLGEGRSGGPVAPDDTGKPSVTEGHDKSLKEFNQQVTNPLSNEWSLELKQSNYLLNSPNAWNPEFQFEPVLPVALTTDWNLVARPVFKFFDSNPYANSTGNSAREEGLGDSTLTTLLSPNTSNWLLGLGPTFVLPTATTQHTGDGKWQAGPAAVFGYLGGSFLLNDRGDSFLNLSCGDGWIRSRPAGLIPGRRVYLFRFVDRCII